MITFLLNNYKDRELLEPALKWEKRFVEFLQNVDSPLMDVAFSAERSIEDGIREVSEAEASTVLISYLVMFAYVALALGRFRGWRTLLVMLKKLDIFQIHFHSF